MTIDLDISQQVLEAMVSKAHELDVPMSIAVCDNGGHLVGFVRMDNCMLLATETVQAKARAAVYFRRPTAETVEMSRKHPTVYTSFVEVSVAPIVLSMGGIPLWHGEDLLGAVAAAGGTGEEDVIVARAGAALWEGLAAGASK